MKCSLFVQILFRLSQTKDEEVDKWRQECDRTRDDLETQLQRLKGEKAASESELKGDLDSLRRELETQRDRNAQVTAIP